MKFIKRELFYILLILIIAFLLTFDLFSRSGQPATFDGPTHITTIAQFVNGFKDGELRVMWGDGFANYGMPIPLISQQITANLGAVLNFILNNVILSYNLVFLIGAFFSTLFYYFFLRIYFTQPIAFAGAFLFNFAPYRIINIYIRGAQPEFFAGVFIPLILIAIYLTVKKRSTLGLPLIILSTALLILTHPFLFVIASFLFIPYIIYCLYNKKQQLHLLLQLTLSFALGIALTAYYTVPLFLEIKYFYYGSGSNHLAPNNFLGIANFFDPQWYYYYKNDVFVRGNFIKVGLAETLIMIAGGSYLLYSLIRKRHASLLLLSIITSLLIIIFMLPFSQILYDTLPIINGIQHPWRLLSALTLVTPIIACILLQKISKTQYQLTAIAIVIFTIAVIRFPELYGKNYTFYPQEYYYFTTKNLHGNVLNTVWTGKTSEYPVKKNKVEIIEGTGKIMKQNIKNSSRIYEVYATSKIRMVDYTFYFPGWNVYVDGKEIPIQYQDPNYRGVITYEVPEGQHQIRLQFGLTKVRLAGYIISLLALIASCIFLYGIYHVRLIKRTLGIATSERK